MFTGFEKWLGEIQPHHQVHGSTGTGRITSDNPRSEDPMAILDALVAGAGDVPGATFEVVPERRAAIGRAVSLAGRGDVETVRAHVTDLVTTAPQTLPFP